VLAADYAEVIGHINRARHKRAARAAKICEMCADEPAPSRSPSRRSYTRHEGKRGLTACARAMMLNRSKASRVHTYRPMILRTVPASGTSATLGRTSNLPADRPASRWRPARPNPGVLPGDRQPTERLRIGSAESVRLPSETLRRRRQRCRVTRTFCPSDSKKPRKA